MGWAWRGDRPGVAALGGAASEWRPPGGAGLSLRHPARGARDLGVDHRWHRRRVACSNQGREPGTYPQSHHDTPHDWQTPCGLLQRTKQTATGMGLCASKPPTFRAWTALSAAALREVTCQRSSRATNSCETFRCATCAEMNWNRDTSSMMLDESETADRNRMEQRATTPALSTRNPTRLSVRASWAGGAACHRTPGVSGSVVSTPSDAPRDTLISARHPATADGFRRCAGRSTVEAMCGTSSAAHRLGCGQWRLSPRTAIASNTDASLLCSRPIVSRGHLHRGSPDAKRLAGDDRRVPAPVLRTCCPVGSQHRQRASARGRIGARAAGRVLACISQAATRRVRARMVRACSSIGTASARPAGMRSRVAPGKSDSTISSE